MIRCPNCTAELEFDTKDQQVFCDYCGSTFDPKELNVEVKKASEEKSKIQKTADKHFELFMLMNQWIKVKQDGKNIASFFESNGYKKIAIYGMSYLGEALIYELNKSNIEIAYGIDRSSDGIYVDINILSIDDFLDEVDAIVVTAITYFEEIKEILQDKVDCPIISLEDILYEI